MWKKPVSCDACWVPPGAAGAAPSERENMLEKKLPVLAMLGMAGAVSGLGAAGWAFACAAGAELP